MLYPTVTLSQLDSNKSLNVPAVFLHLRACMFQPHGWVLGGRTQRGACQLDRLIASAKTEAGMRCAELVSVGMAISCTLLQFVQCGWPQ